MNSSALAARFVSGPYITASSTAEQRLGDWLAELEPQQAAEIGAWLDRPPARAILLGIVEFSPYLFDLIRADAARLIRLLACDPEQHLTSLIEKTSRDVLAAAGEADVMHLLRRMKSEAALLIALCDIGGVWPVMRVTAALTDLAVTSVQAALALPVAPGGRARPHDRLQSRPAGGGLWPDRARDGQDGRGRTELFQRHRPDRVFRSRRHLAGRRTSSRRRSSCA